MSEYVTSISKEPILKYFLFNFANKPSVCDIVLATADITMLRLCFTDGSPDEWRHLLDVNVVALCLCTREAVASMQRRNVKDGHIFNLSRSVQLTPGCPGVIKRKIRFPI